MVINMDIKEKITDYTVDEIITMCRNTNYTCEGCLFGFSDDDCLFNYSPSDWYKIYELEIAKSQKC